MADADELLREGNLSGARAALVEVVRSQPSSEQGRMFLFQLFAVLGEWDKARNQLQALAQLSPEAQMLSVTYNQAMDAEKQRAAVLAGEADMPLLAGAGGWAEGIARSITLLGRGEVDAAIAARDEAFDSAPDTPGSIDGVKFDWISDADGRFGPTTTQARTTSQKAVGNTHRAPARRLTQTAYAGQHTSASTLASVPVS